MQLISCEKAHKKLKLIKKLWPFINLFLNGLGRVEEVQIWLWGWCIIFSGKCKREASYYCSFQCCRRRSWKVFETNSSFIFCSGIAVSKQIKKCIDSKLSPGTSISFHCASGFFFLTSFRFFTHFLWKNVFFRSMIKSCTRKNHPDPAQIANR